MEKYESIIKYLRENPRNELELRFGKKVKNKFISGIKHSFFQEIHDDLITTDGILKNEYWHETMDVFFDHKKKELRTRVSYPSETMFIEKETIEKKKLSSIFAICDTSDFDFRISVSSEEKVSNENLPSIVNPKYVRLKHSKSFFIMKDNIKIWRIDLSKCWSSDSRTSVEEKQHTETPIYEVECELVDTDNYLKSHDDFHILSSIMMKGLGIAGNPNLNYKFCK